jgi:SAM-dependent methyltransferase
MDIKTVRFLHEVNNRFYQKQGASFAQTRGAPWQGWTRCLEVLQAEGLTLALPTPKAEESIHSSKSDCTVRSICEPKSLSVLDIASGNARFEDFLQESLPEIVIDYYAVDNSIEMASGRQTQNLDVLDLMIKAAVLEDKYITVNELLEAPLCDLSVSFGFMHHIPSQELRKALLNAMISNTKLGGFIIVSFWQFLKSIDLAHKAKVVHKQALAELDSVSPFSNGDELQTALDKGDYFLGWQDKVAAYRYCHSFSESEIDALVASVAERTKLVAHFSADGRTQNLNSYIVLEVH